HRHGPRRENGRGPVGTGFPRPGEIDYPQREPKDDMAAVKAKRRTQDPPRAAARELVPWGGEAVDVDRFWAESWVDLLNRQRWLSRKLKLDNAPWLVDQNAGIIQFERKDGAIVTAPIQIIGAWNPRTQMFRWAWDHPMVAQRLKNDAERTRWFGDKHGLEELTVKSLKLSEQE